MICSPICSDVIIKEKVFLSSLIPDSPISQCIFSIDTINRQGALRKYFFLLYSTLSEGIKGHPNDIL